VAERADGEPIALPRSTEVLALAGVCSVAVLGMVSLGMAQLDRFDGRLAVGITLALAVVAGLVVRRVAPTGLARDRAGMAVTALALVLAAAWFLPGAPYALGDKDPGVYVNHSMAIERDGSTQVDDAVLERIDPDQVVQISPGARFPGLWISPDDPTAILPQFYHLWPSMQAVGVDFAGEAGAFHLAPLLGALAVVVLGLAVRAALDGPEGAIAGLAAGALVAANMMEVWQTRYPTTEVLSQLLLVGALLGATVAMRTGWAPAAASVGLLATVGFLARPDGILFVGLVAVALGLLVATRQDARSLRWLAGGLLVPLPYALWNAYEAARSYTLGNDVPTLPTFLGALALIAVAAVAGRAIWPWLVRRTTRPKADHAAERPERLPRWLAIPVLLGAGALLLFFWYRGDVHGELVTDYNGTEIRTYDELNLQRIAFFTTRVALVGAWLGLGVVLLRSTLPGRIAVLCAPGLVVTPVYLWAARNSPRLMWWARRYVPLVLPTLLVLVAVLVAYLMVQRGWWRWPARVVGAALLAFLLVDAAGQSLDLRGHREMGGSWTLLERVDDARGDADGVYLWRYADTGLYDASRNLGGSMITVHGQASTMLHPEPTQDEVDLYVAAFPDHEIFVVTQGTELPGTIDPARFEVVDDFTGHLSVWEETFTERPDEAIGIDVPVRIYRLISPASAPAG
jgi:hypothetical protein